MRYTTEAIGQKIRAIWREDLPRHESLWPESPIDGERFPLLAGLTGCSTSGDYLRFLPRDREVRFDEPQTLGPRRARLITSARPRLPLQSRRVGSGCASPSR